MYQGRPEEKHRTALRMMSYLLRSTFHKCSLHMPKAKKEWQMPSEFPFIEEHNHEQTYIS